MADQLVMMCCKPLVGYQKLLGRVFLVWCRFASELSQPYRNALDTFNEKYARLVFSNVNGYNATSCIFGMLIA